MMSKEDFEKLIDSLRDKLDETQRALVSEDFLNVKSAYNSLYDDVEKDKFEIAKLNQDKQDLLIANGKLFQKVGIEKEEVKDEIIEKKEDEKSDEELIDELIDERGEII